MVEQGEPEKHILWARLTMLMSPLPIAIFLVAPMLLGCLRGQCERPVVFGSAIVHCGGVPTIAGGGKARVGSSGFTLRVGNALPGNLAAFVIGARALQTLSCGSSGSLPLHAVGGSSVIVGVGPAGTAALPVPIPPGSGLIGFRFAAQFVQLETTAPCSPCRFGGVGVASSPGLETTIVDHGCAATGLAGVVGNLAQPPTIQIAAAQNPGVVHGTASNIDGGAHQVVPYVLTDQLYVQPLLCAPFADLCASSASNATWQTTVHPWQRLVVLLVDPTFDPAATLAPYSPSLLPGVLAADGLPTLPAVHTFAGREWGTKVSPCRFGPGNNYWDDSQQNVRVDALGRLHLEIVQQPLATCTGTQNVWTCSEVRLAEPLGYGSYTFEVDVPLDDLGDNVVFSGFLYEDAANEADIEFSKTLVSGAEDAQYVVQPWSTPGNLFKFNMGGAPQSTHRIEWQPGAVTFTSWQGPGTTGPVIQGPWIYTGPDVPEAGALWHFNVWLVGGAAPGPGRRHVIVRSFDHQ